MTIDIREGERLDDLGRKGYRIIQNPKTFCFGIDAVLLTGFARVKSGSHVLDLGTGTGIIPILLEAKTEASHLTGLEIQEESADMARRSVALNCNPPYMIGDHGLTGGNRQKTIARHEVLCTFEDVAREAAVLLKPGGNFYLVHRPFRLVELFNTLTRHGLEPKRMKLVHPFVDKEPNMVLIEAKKGGNSRITVESPLIVYKEPGVYTDEIYDIYKPAVYDDRIKAE